MSEHFVKQSYGTMWHFCHNSRGICFCSMTDEHITEYEILLDNGQKDFDVLIDDSDTIHLICQDEVGNIIYINNEEKSWKKYTLLQSKSLSSYQKNFVIKRFGNWINILYTIDYKGKKLLSHQILESSDVPSAVDYIDGDFSASMDENGNIYALYTNLSGSLGWRIYVWGKKEWSDFVPVTTSGKLIHPYIYADEKIHITGIIDNKIVYLSGTSENIVSNAGTRPIIIKNEEFLYIMWENKRDGKVYLSLSSDKGVTFQKPTEFMAGRFASVKLFKLSYTSFENFAANHCYGYIRDSTVSLYLLGDFLKISRTRPKPVAPPVQREGNIELTKLKIHIQQLNDALSKATLRLDSLERKMSDSINDINSKTDLFEKMIKNLSATEDSAEKEVIFSDEIDFNEETEETEEISGSVE